MFADFDRLRFLVESAYRAQRLNLRFDDDVGFGQFAVEGGGAHDVEGLVEVGEEVFARRGNRFGGDVHGDDEVRALSARGGNGYGLGQTAVHVAAAGDDDGLEDVGDGGGGADGLSGVAPVEGDGFAGGEVGGDGGEFNRELLDGAVADFVVDVVLQFFAFDEAAGGEGEVDEVGFAEDFGFEFHAVGRHAAGVHAADYRARAGAGNDFDGDVVLFEDFEDADVGEAFGCATAQCDGDDGLRFLAGNRGLAAAGLGTARAGGEQEGAQGGQGGTAGVFLHVFSFGWVVA